MQDRRDVTVDNLQTVIPVGRHWLVGKSAFIQGTVKPISAPISSENPPSSVATMGSGSQPHDQ
jgi:hypothetical protein